MAAKEGDRSSDRIMSGILFLFTVLTVIVLGLMMNLDSLLIIKISVFLPVLDILLLYYVRTKEVSMVSEKHYRMIVLATYFYSLICVFLMIRLELSTLWMLGPVLAACLLNRNIGLLYDLIFSFVLFYAKGSGLDLFVYQFVMCTALVILSGYLAERLSMLYVIMIVLSSNITMLLLTNEFDYDLFFEQAFWREIAVTFMILLACRLALWTAERYLKITPEPSSEPVFEVISESAAGLEEPETETLTKTASDAVQIPEDNPGMENRNDLEPVEEAVTEIVPDHIIGQLCAEQGLADIVKMPAARSTAVMPDHAYYDKILSDDYPLVRQMKEEDPALYRHSMKVGELSFVAAEIIHKDRELARAGGYYHDIGKLVSSNYIKEGIRILKEKNFPAVMIDIIKQHNIKVSKPKSPEAAIVMLSDTVLSSLVLLREDKKNVSPQKLVYRIFDMRLDNGDLDSSGLSLEQYKVLKDYYVNAVKLELMAEELLKSEAQQYVDSH